MTVRIIGVALVRNEDVFIERALRNALAFCDRIVVTDHRSTDNTWAIVRALAKEVDRLDCVQIRHPAESHELIQGYAGTDTWVFGVDGDEIYDPGGLRRFRETLLQGRYREWWQIMGNVLNCERIDYQRGVAWGYLAPPSRSMTKLYNFGAISAWTGPCPERLHGGAITFRPGYDRSLRYNLHEELTWEVSPFRCLHTCFLRRSSQDRAGGVRERRNITEKDAEGWWGRVGLGRLRRWLAEDPESWKRRKYTRGALVEVDVSGFLRPCA